LSAGRPVTVDTAIPGDTADAAAPEDLAGGDGVERGAGAAEQAASKTATTAPATRLNESLTPTVTPGGPAAFPDRSDNPRGVRDEHHRYRMRGDDSIGAGITVAKHPVLPQVAH